MLVTKNVITKEEVIAATKELAGKLGRPPRYAEVIRVVNVTRRQIQRMFGGWAAVLEESGCERIRLGGGELTMHELWHDWVAVARKAERMPTIRQYEKFGRYSVRPLKDRFCAWERIPAAMLEYGDSKGLWAGWEDVRELIGRKVDMYTLGERCTRSPESRGIAVNGETTPTTEARRRGEKQNQAGDPLESYSSSGYRRQHTVSRRKLEAAAVSRDSSLRSELRRKAFSRGEALHFPTPELLDESLLYGEPLGLAPMATAPTNEAGVMFLFATLARELGFVVLKVQKGFPDCEALRRLPNGRWQRLRIEFEFASRNFVLHGHDVKGCELIVCWENDWKECPVEVMELKKIFEIG